MLGKNLFVLILCAAALNFGCQSSESTNKNVSLSANSNASANVSPDFSGTPSIMTNSAPGISSNPQSGNLNMSNLSTPIPGITDTKNDGRPLPKNTPPIPGIPSEAELKRQMNTPISNSKITERKPPVAEPNPPVGPMYKPRRNNKP